MRKNELFLKIKQIHKSVRHEMISLIEQNISPDISRRRSTLSSHALATVLAHTALETSFKKTSQWIEENARGMNIVGIPTSFSESSPLMAACFTILEKVCGFSLPSLLREKLPSIEEIVKKLDYSYSFDDCYILPFHLACAALLCTIKGVKIPRIHQMISDLQQRDGSWTDDTTITALSAIALQKEGIEPRYDVQNWLKREQLPNGSWAAVNGEVWEASSALRTGEVQHTSRLVTTLKECVHPNYWWGFSRYAVPDIDDTAAACCALAPYEPHLVTTVCEKLCTVQHETGGWGAFPQITGVVPEESVIGTARALHNDVTCHVLEAFERNNTCGPAFKKGILYLLKTQEKDGHWRTTWWNSDIYATVEIALLLNRHGYYDPVFHSLKWLEEKVDEPLNSTECALLIKVFSQFSEFSDSLDKVVNTFLKQYTDYPPPFDGVHFVGLIDYKLYRLSTIVSSLRTLLKTLQTRS